MRISIRSALVAAIAGLLAIAFGLILLTWQNTTDEVIDQHARALLAESSEVGVSQSEAYVAVAREALDLTVGLASVSDVFAGEDVAELFYQELEVAPALAGVFVGSLDGDFVFVSRNQDFVDDGYRTKVVEFDGDQRATTLTFHDGDFNVLQSRPDPTDTYDPRVRPWFEAALADRGAVWTDPYIFFTSQQPGITASEVVIDPDTGEPSGVFGVDVELGALGAFLDQVKIRDESRVFLFDRQGSAIAYSESDASLYREEGDRLVLKEVSDIDDSRTSGAFESLIQIHPDLDFDTSVLTNFEVDGDRHYAYFAPLSSANVDWIVGAEVSDEAFVGAIRQGQRRGIALAVVVAVIAVLLGVVLSRAISSPMGKLRQLANAAVDGNAHELPRVRSMFREIQETADALTASQLQLESRVNDRTRELQAEVTERKDAEFRAVSASKAKTSFLTNMSHELRTPLNAIIGLAELVEAEAYGPLGSSHYKEYAGDIVNAGSHLVGLINELLDLTRIESGALTIDPEPLEVVEVIKNSVRLVEQLAVEKGIRLEVDVDDGLPTLMADRLRVRQVMVNLLSNAIKFTPSGGRVTAAGTLADQAEIHLSVEDTGIGMTPAEVEVALSLFGQVNENRGDLAIGTGIGLTLSSKLVEGHGGRLLVESQPTRGTKVTACFPDHRTLWGPIESPPIETGEAVTTESGTMETVGEGRPQAS
jgi:signal transduction histidine kinase